LQKKRGRRPSPNPKRETQPSPNCQTPAGPWPSFSFLCARPIPPAQASPGNPARLLLPSLPRPAQFPFPRPALFFSLTARPALTSRSLRSARFLLSPAALTRAQAHASAPRSHVRLHQPAPRSSSTPPHAHNTAPGPARLSPRERARPAHTRGPANTPPRAQRPHPASASSPRPAGPTRQRHVSPAPSAADSLDPPIRPVFSVETPARNGSAVIFAAPSAWHAHPS